MGSFVCHSPGDAREQERRDSWAGSCSDERREMPSDRSRPLCPSARRRRTCRRACPRSRRCGSWGRKLRRRTHTDPGVRATLTNCTVGPVAWRRRVRSRGPILRRVPGVGPDVSPAGEDGWYPARFTPPSSSPSTVGAVRFWVQTRCFKHGATRHVSGSEPETLRLRRTAGFTGVLVEQPREVGRFAARTE